MIKYEEVENSYINQGDKILLFSAKWCKDCIAIDAYIDEVAKDNDSWKFIYVDIDTNMEVAQKYDIFGIPSFVALSEGKVISDLISKDPKPKSLINSWIKTIKVING